RARRKRARERHGLLERAITDLCRELRTEWSVADDGHALEWLARAEDAGRLDEVGEALLLHEPSDRHHRSAAAVWATACELAAVNPHDHLVHVRARRHGAQVAHRVLTAAGRDRGALQLLAEVARLEVDVVAVRRDAVRQ